MLITGFEYLVKLSLLASDYLGLREETRQLPDLLQDINAIDMADPVILVPNKVEYDECILFEHTNYNGKRLSLRLGDNEELMFDLHEYDFDDKMSSFMCGANVRYHFCNNDPDDDCTGWNGISGAGAVDCSRSGRPDMATTVFMYAYDRFGGPGGATFFRDDYC